MPMPMRFGTGVAAVAALAVGGLARRAWRNGIWRADKGAAYQPWRSWERSNGREKLIHSAILAANAHNTQPWSFREERDTITVFANFERHIGSFDPYRREMHLSIGCALENLDQAARAQGLKTRTDFTPGALAADSPPTGPAAVIRLSPGKREATELFWAIPQRHTHRGAYDADQEIPEQVLASMRQAVPQSPPMRLFLFTGQNRNPLAHLIVSATRAIIADRQMSDDNARWFRFDRESIERSRDGLTLDTNVAAPLANFAAKLFPPSAEHADRHWLRDTEKVHVGTARLLGIIAVRDLYDRPTTLVAGRLWQRLHLFLTARGIAAQPLNQPVERVDRERTARDGSSETAEALAQITEAPSWQPTFIFRAGYAARPAALSPRRDVREVIEH